jgi:hypothetical protein
VTIQDARADGQHGTVVSALTLSARLVGLLKDRLEVSNVGPYSDCSTSEQVISSLIEKADGDAHSVLDLLREMTAMVEERVASQASVVDAKPKAKVDELEKALAIYRS